MKKVMVIGCSGSGKSTFATEMASRTGLELIHLDQYYWKPHWVESDMEEWKAACAKLTEKDNWVIDGNYGSTMDERLKKADTIIYLNMPTWLCLYRIFKRWFEFRGQTRPSMTRDCPERMNLEFVHYVLTYRMIREKSILQKLKKLPDGKTAVILNSSQEVKAYWERFGEK